MIRFAVTGVERSGTHWLAALLDESPGVNVYHEPALVRVLDARIQGLAHGGLLDAAYYARTRYNYWQRYDRYNGDMAEVNAVIRYLAPTIRDVWGIPVAGLIRDGRHTVRSLVKRGTFTRPDLPPFDPPPETAGDVFAACCWMWAESYDRLEAAEIPIWRLEDLNADHGEVLRLCGFLGIEPVPEPAWARLVGVRMAASIQDTEPPQWDREQVDTFNRWAGEVQARHGYDGAGGTG